MCVKRERDDKGTDDLSVFFLHLHQEKDSHFALIVLCDQPTDEDYRDGVKKRQIVMELDMATWRVSFLSNITSNLRMHD